MNMNYTETSAFCKKFNKLVRKNRKVLKESGVLFGVAPTFLGLLPTKAMLTQKAIIGAQDCSAIEKGAYTSQVSYSQLKEFQVEYVILGHSEVRHYLHETNSRINAKAKTLLANNMVPIICVGETLAEYKAKKTNDVLRTQIIECTKDIDREIASKIIIAYEPIWAIGTGITPTLKEITRVCTFIRNLLNRIFGRKAGAEITILYGGSVNAKNSKSILALKNVDGGLVGGASMNPDSFMEIIKSSPSFIKAARRAHK